MNIVRIIARLNVGGPAKHVAWLTAALARAGHESVLVTGTVAAGEDDMSYFARAQGVSPVVIPQMSREISPKDALTVWKLYRLLVRLKPDIVHTHTAKAGTAGRLAGVLYRWLTPAALWGRPRACRFVHTYHGHVFHSYYGRRKTRLFLGIERALARLCTDRIVVISPQQYREIHEEFGVGRAGQFAVIPLGLDTGAFKDWRRRRGAARAELGVVDEETLLVGIVGRLTDVKNHRLFLEAAARYKATRGASDVGGHGRAGDEIEDGRTSGENVGDGAARVRFVVVGDGQLRAGLEEYARTLGLSGDDVTFTGTRRDPENFYAALDVVALASLNEGTPLTLIEAMANERAVVATAVGGVVDLLGAQTRAFQTAAPTPERRAVAASSSVSPATDVGAQSYTVCERGLLVRSGDAEGMTEAIARLVADEELRRELGARGASYVERTFSVERLVADVTRLYEELHATGAAREKAQGEKAAGGKGEMGKWAKGEEERTSAV